LGRNPTPPEPAQSASPFSFSRARPSRHPFTVRPTDSSPRTAGPARPSLQFSSHGPGEAQWPAPDEPSSSSPWRPRRRTRTAHPRVKKSSPNRIKTDPRSNPTMLRDRIPVMHVKDPKIPINRTPSRRILAQNRAQTLEAPVVHRPTTTSLPLLDRCPANHLGPPPPHLIGPR
jgi:hypothetical protein